MQSLSSISRAQWCGRILIACRVSVLSALAGLLLFAFVPQARDFFADITHGPLPQSWRAWGFWLLFFLYISFVWAFPVHFAARTVLESTNDWMIPRRLRAAVNKGKSRNGADALPEELTAVKTELRLCIELLPRVLGAFPFLAVLIGLWKAYSVVKDTQALEPAAAAQEQIVVLLFLDIFFLFVFELFLWKRKRLVNSLGEMSWRSLRRTAPKLRDKVPEDLDKFMKFVSHAAIWISVSLSAAIFALSFFAPAFLAQIAPRALIVPFLFGSLVFVGAVLAWLSDRYGLPLLLLAIVLAFGVTSRNIHFNDLRHLPDEPQNVQLRQIEIDDAVTKWRAANCDGEGCPPALIVAAEGGASRAAFAAATVLGDLFDHAKDLPDGGKGALAPARRVFAISGVSGGSFGAATIRTALWEALGQSAPPCKRAPREWFLATDAAADRLVAQSWRACLQALVSGDYLTPAFVGLGFRDNLSPPNPFSGATILQDDRATLLEKAWERHFEWVIRPSHESETETTQNAVGLRRPFGYVRKALEGHPGAWLPLLLLNGASVDNGARIIASDLVSTEKGGGPRPASRQSLYPAAFDLFEMLSKPCPHGDVDGDSCADAHQGAADLATVRDGPDVRLSTTALLSARFPVVSPAGVIRAKGDSGVNGDRVVDGGYFENAGLTTALDVARALKARKITPIVLWVRNDPIIDEEDYKSKDAGVAKNERATTVAKTSATPQFPPRAAGSPRMQGANPDGISAFFGVVATPLEALAATRDGHAAEAADLIQRRLEEMNKDSCPQASCTLGASYFMFRMFKNPQFDVSSDECKWLAPTRAKPPVMSEVSMSWWLSQAVQAELNSQICDTRNRDSLANLKTRLSQSLKSESMAQAK